jgi:hypothetical protein
MTGWELAISTGAVLIAGVGGTTLGALVQGLNARRLYQLEAEERRQRHFLAERRAAYTRYLAALAEWEPLRDKAWRLRQEADQSPGSASAESRWRAARVESEGPERRLVDRSSAACRHMTMLDLL